MVKNEKVKIYLAKSEEQALANYNNMIINAENMGLQKLVDWATTVSEEEEFVRVNIT
ncbi:hypothetical protein [Paenibacillus anseongensis]|uniref:hypothetical protein n=1 Tax=Paenibacillus TaxID=44249 RepID=UPI001FE6DA50|nr:MULTISPECIES: hypothetical protein [Paenibacillus]